MEFRTALHWAAVLGSTEMVTLLLERGGSPLAPDAVGATPLHYAVSYNIMYPAIMTLTILYSFTYRHRITMW